MLKLKKVLCGAVAVMIAGMPFFANAEVNMSAAGDDGKIHIYGNLGTNASAEFIVKVLRNQDDKLTAENINSRLVALEQVLSENDGSFTIEVPVSDSVESGTYLIQLTIEKSSSVNKEISFYYLSEAERAEIIKGINVAANADAVRDIVLANTEKLNISLEDLYNSLDMPERVFNRIYKIKDIKAFEKLGEIQQAFMESCALEAMQECNSESEVMSFIASNNSLFKIDLTAAQALNNTNAVGKRLLNKGFSTVSEFQTRFDEVVCTEAFNQGTRSEMKELIDKYAEQINISQKYTSAADKTKNELYKALESQTAFDKYSDITKYVNEWFDLDNGNKNQNTSGGSSSGSMGGGGGKLGTGMMNDNLSDDSKTNQSSSALTPGTKFSDLGDVSWAVEAIEYLANLKIINGVSEDSFEPNRSITREEFVKILVKAFDIKSEGKAVGFTDVLPDSWCAPYVYAAAENNIVNGISEQTFGIGEEITRQDMAVMLCRVLEAVNQNLQETQDMPEFNDEAEFAGYAGESIAMLCKGGIMNGVSETQFDPSGSATRAMAAKVIYLLIAAKN